MRIAHVVLSLGIGGQERLIVSLASALRSRGHDVHIVSLSPGGELRSTIRETPVHDVVRTSAGLDPTLSIRLARLFRRLELDVVHTHNAVPMIYAAVAGRAAGCRVVHTRHGQGSHLKGRRYLVRAACRFVHSFVAVSENTAVAATKNERPPKDRIHVIENGIPLAAFGADLEARREIRAELAIPADALVVGTVGRLAIEKDYPLLVRAMTPMLSERVRLVFVGEGAERPAIEAAIEARVRPFVTLTGARHDVPRLLASFDLFALSSKTEGLPLVLPEAMTSRLPVISTAVGGIPSVVPESVGILVPYGDSDALGAAIRRLIDDEALRTTMAEAARNYALGRFSEDRMLDEYLALYRGRP
jgi:glycosyltransferase involved in cell wall biosynthesis